MEDDADWSIYLKDQLEHVAAGSRYVESGSTTTVPLNSPYGDDWDMLWLGHCGTTFSPTQHRRYVIENDSTVPPPAHRSNNKAPDLSALGYGNSTRVVYEAGGGLCLQAYALSLRGARKILQFYMTRTEFSPIDLDMHRLCKEQILGFRCVGVFPQLWGSHRSAGYTHRDSDIQGSNRVDKGKFRAQAMTFNVVHSVRLNGERIIAHGMGAVTSQWDDMPVLEGEVRTRVE